MNEFDLFHETHRSNQNVVRDLTYWRDIADRMSSKENRPWMVTENFKSEYGTYPASMKVDPKFTKVIYTTS